MYNNIYECPRDRIPRTLYRGRPRFKTQVAVLEAIEKADGAVFRCMLSGSGADRWLLISASN